MATTTLTPPPQGACHESPPSPPASEAERLLADPAPGRAVRLEGSWKKLLKRMPALGPIRCHTGNRAILHDRLGPYRWVRFIFNAGQTGGPEVDLRLFMQNWAHGFAVTDPECARSFQFFDKYGSAIHKVFLTEESDAQAFEVILREFQAADQSARPRWETIRPRQEKPDAEVDVELFRKKWRRMWDTHQFFSLHRKFGLHRLQALRLGPPELVRPLSPEAGRQLFEQASRQDIGFMTFSGNRGCLQIYKGVAHGLRREADWFEVREGGFRLRIHEPSIAQAFEVKKPTLFGPITSVELFDEFGENVAVFYGKRRRIEPEHADWCELCAGLETLAG
jgi:putative hemin transport protein